MNRNAILRIVYTGMLALVASFSIPAEKVWAQPWKTEFTGGEITIDSIKRTSDETVLLKGSIKNTGNETLFPFNAKITDSNYIFIAKLQDLKTKKQYEQVTVNDKRVGAAVDTIKPGQSAVVWARITAPPKDVNQVSIQLGEGAIPIDLATISE